MCALASAESLLAVAARMAYPVRMLYHSIDRGCICGIWRLQLLPDLTTDECGL